MGKNSRVAPNSSSYRARKTVAYLLPRFSDDSRAKMIACASSHDLRTGPTEQSRDNSIRNDSNLGTCTTAHLNCVDMSMVHGFVKLTGKPSKGVDVGSSMQFFCSQDTSFLLHGRSLLDVISKGSNEILFK